MKENNMLKYVFLFFLAIVIISIFAMKSDLFATSFVVTTLAFTVSLLIRKFLINKK